jgi:hypothetical protein
MEIESTLWASIAATATLTVGTPSASRAVTVGAVGFCERVEIEPTILLAPALFSRVVEAE